MAAASQLWVGATLDTGDDALAIQESTTRVLLADFWLQRANLDREIAFQENDPRGPDTKALDELRSLVAELDRLIEEYVCGEAPEARETAH